MQIKKCFLCLKEPAKSSHKSTILTKLLYHVAQNIKIPDKNLLQYVSEAAANNSK